MIQTNEGPPEGAGKATPRRRRWLTALASLVFTGLGQVIAGHPARAFVWLGIQTACLAAIVAAMYLGSPLLCWLSIAVGLMVYLASVWDAWRIPRRDPFPSRLRLVVAATALLGIAFSLDIPRRNLIGSYRTATPSMEPGIAAGDYIFTTRLWSGIHRGDIVMFTSPQDETTRFLKRVVAVAGDEVEMRKGELIINGSAVERHLLEPCADGLCNLWRESIDGRSWKIRIENTDFKLYENYGPETVPDGHVFVVGDNRDNSLDSREFGPVRLDAVFARPAFIYWSMGSAEDAMPGAGPRIREIHWDRINHVIE
ncbi:MAG TPA: signal peptidase I [Terriglobia bacterium]|nr:signal peptidase I [Terriglobia bacterium]